LGNMGSGPGRRGDCSPRLPQIRTCPIKASGSSGCGLTCAVLPGGFTLTAPGALCPLPVAFQQFRNQASPSLSWVPTHGFPNRLRYYETLRLPVNRPAALRFASLGRTIPRACFRLSAQVRRRPGAGSFRSGSSDATFVEMESQGLPSSWGILMCLRRVLRPRPDRSPHRHGGASVLPP